MAPGCPPLCPNNGDFEHLIFGDSCRLLKEDKGERVAGIGSAKSKKKAMEQEAASGAPQRGATTQV